MISDTPISAGFLLYLAAVAAVLAAVLLRYLPRRQAGLSIAVLAAWLGYSGLVGYEGVVRTTILGVPGIFWLVTPVLAFMAIVLGRSAVGIYLASRIPLPLLIGLQLFRLGVEYALQKLWEAGLIPASMTLAGGNIEIYAALMAPAFAWLSVQWESGRGIAFVWNTFGILSLVNIVTRALLTAPGPLNLIHADTPNVAMGLFPFSFIPGFFVPLALALHILTFRAISHANRSASEAKLQAAGTRPCAGDPEVECPTQAPGWRLAPSRSGARHRSPRIAG
jgi:hypothetical protein